MCRARVELKLEHQEQSGTFHPGRPAHPLLHEDTHLELVDLLKHFLHFEAFLEDGRQRAPQTQVGVTPDLKS